jgi:hypothetical protein
VVPSVDEQDRGLAQLDGTFKVIGVEWHAVRDR